MAEFFKCGSVSVPVGATDMAVSSSIPFTPDVVRVSVRQPEADSPLITAYVTGTPTRSGFTISLSSPAESSGYYLEWTAFSNRANPSVAGDTLSLDYNALKDIVSRYLGWDPTALTDMQKATVDACIQSGVRRFYYPPSIDQIAPWFEWSFMRQRGYISATAGTASYSLPDGFGRIEGQATIVGEPGPNVVIIPIGDIVRMSQRGETGRPRFAAVSADQEFGARGQSKRISFYPIPDKAYEIEFACDADTGKIDPVNRPFPLGGSMFAELVKESCLSVAEQDVNDTKEIHTENFTQLLSAMVNKDSRSGAQVFGMVGDPANASVEWGVDQFYFHKRNR